MSKAEDDDVDAHERALGYTVSLIIHHPSIDPDVITEQLGLTPHLSWRAGTSRRSPTGTLTGGLHTRNSWSYSCFVEGNRRFAIDIELMLEELELHAEFLRHVSKDAQSMQLMLRLEGERNIGDAIDAQLLRRLGELRMGLGIEVFPKTNRRIPGAKG